jgi:LysM repeat protein
MRILIKIVLPIFCLVLTGIKVSAISIADSVGVETINGRIFIQHKVTSGEGWYSIARKYGISYSELRMSNKAEGDQLRIGQIVRIPPHAKINDPRFRKNFTDESVKPSDKPEQSQEQVLQSDKAEKRKHKVQQGETLFGISRMYSVSVDQLKKWNKLSDNTISKGQELIVGESEELKRKSGTLEENLTGKTKTVEKAEVTPLEREKEVVKTEPQPLHEVNRSSEKKEVLAESRKPDKKVSFAKGRQEINEAGLASWQEDNGINQEKYYALHRSAPVGTIIRVTNSQNKSSVFVKVVGHLDDSPDNEDVIIKISRTSAERLNVIEKKFQAELVYGLPAN